MKRRNPFQFVIAIYAPNDIGEEWLPPELRGNEYRARVDRKLRAIKTT